MKKIFVISFIVIHGALCFSHTPENLAKDIHEFNSIPAAVAIVEHIFTLQNKQQTKNSDVEALCDTTDRCVSRYVIDNKLFMLYITFEPTWKGTLCVKAWSSNDIGSKPYQEIWAAFRKQDFWIVSTELSVGKFITCSRTGVHSNITCTSTPALTRELFAELKRQHDEKKKSNDTKK